MMLVDPITQYAFGWGPFENSELFAGLCVHGVVVTLLATQLHKRMTDLGMVCFGLMFGCFATGFGIVFWKYNMNKVTFIFGMALIVTGGPLWKAPNEARFNKINSKLF